MERVAKIIRDCGICSRREAEEYIRNGRVELNGVKLTDLAICASIQEDSISLDGRLLYKKLEPRLWIFNKPPGIITTKKDPQNRRTIYDLLPKKMQNLMYVGRLDYNSEGLLLLTNSAKIKHQLERPENNYLRVYRARGFGQFNEEELTSIKGKIIINDFEYKVVYIKLIKRGTSNHWFEIGIEEGKNREVRKIFEKFDISINKLIRTDYSPFSIEGLLHGEFVELTISSFKSILES
jgi:23S rRNA pseudouridine2605 synthase